MQAVINFLRGLFSKEEGQTLAEYALILVLIAVAVIAAVTALGGNIGAVLDRIAAALGVE
ncbi:Flp family type IVb pilin [bacterium]|nr:Flp family type IVb pilin [bacterium]